MLLVEYLNPNLLSVSQTCYQGHIYIFDYEKCEIRKKDSGKPVGTAVRNSSNVYILENEEKCYMSMIDESWIWHRRMGHLNFDNLMKVSKKEAVMDLPKIVKPLNLVCKHCQHGKQTKDNIKVNGHKTSQPLY